MTPCSVGSALREQAAEHHPDSDWISRVLDGDPASLSCEGPLSALTVVSEDARKARFPHGAWRYHDDVMWQPLSRESGPVPGADRLFPEQLLDLLTVGGVCGTCNGRGSWTTADESGAAVESPCTVCGCTGREFTVCECHAELLRPRRVSFDTPKRTSSRVEPPRLLLTELFRVPWDCVKSVCRCGWESEPFPRGQLDSYDHFCAECEQPIARFFPVDGTIPDPRVSEALDRAYGFGFFHAEVL